MKNFSFLFLLLIISIIFGCTTTVEVENQNLGCQTPSNQCIDGKAVYLYPDGTHYEGEFHNGKKHGHGFLKFANGTYYDGEFYNGKRQGNGKGTSLSGGYSYEGEWKNDKPHGRGIQVRDNGERYQGEFQNGKRHGRGEYKWPSGNRHVGEWQNGKKHGRGIHIFADGGILMREWQENQIVRDGRKAVSEYAKMVEAFFRRETGINPHNREKFAEMLGAFLKGVTHDRNDDGNVSKPFSEILLKPGSSANQEEIGQIVKEILIKEGYYFPEG